MKLILIIFGLVTLYSCLGYKNTNKIVNHGQLEENAAKDPSGLHHTPQHKQGDIKNTAKNKSRKCASRKIKFFRLGKEKAHNQTHRETESVAHNREKGVYVVSGSGSGQSTSSNVPYAEIAGFSAAFASAAIELGRGNDEKALWIVLDQLGPYGSLISSIFGISRPVSTDTALILREIEKVQLTADQILHKLNNIVEKIMIAYEKKSLKDEKKKLVTVAKAFKKYSENPESATFKEKFLEQCKAQNLEHILNSLHYEQASTDSDSVNSQLIGGLNKFQYDDVSLSLMASTIVAGSLYLICLNTEFTSQSFTEEVLKDKMHYLKHQAGETEKYFNEISDAVRAGEAIIEHKFVVAFKTEIQNFYGKHSKKSYENFAKDLLNDLTEKFPWRRWMVNVHKNDGKKIETKGEFTYYYAPKNRNDKAVIVVPQKLTPPAPGTTYLQCLKNFEGKAYRKGEHRNCNQILNLDFLNCVTEYSVLACVDQEIDNAVAASEGFSENQNADYRYDKYMGKLYFNENGGKWFHITRVAPNHPYIYWRLIWVR